MTPGNDAGGGILCIARNEQRRRPPGWGVRRVAPREPTGGEKDLSSSHIFPVGGVWWLGGSGGMMGSNAFPDIYAFPLLIPDTALRMEIPVNVDLPDPCGVADRGGHRRKS